MALFPGNTLRQEPKRPGAGGRPAIKPVVNARERAEDCRSGKTSSIFQCCVPGIHFFYTPWTIDSGPTDY